jgi:hypothetical protein
MCADFETFNLSHLSIPEPRNAHPKLIPVIALMFDCIFSSLAQFFKDMMLEARREGENTVIPEGDMSSDGMAGFGVPDYEFLFDELKTTSESGGWKVVTDKKWCRLEDKEASPPTPPKKLSLVNRIVFVSSMIRLPRIK